MLLKPDSSMLILTETICFSLDHSLLYLINFCITLLGLDDPLQQVWLHLQCCHKSLRNYLQSEVLELLTQLRWHTLSISNIDMALTAQRISNNVCCTRMILHIQIIILNKFQPSALPEV